MTATMRLRLGRVVPNTIWPVTLIPLPPPLAPPPLLVVDVGDDVDEDCETDDGSSRLVEFIIETVAETSSVDEEFVGDDDSAVAIEDAEDVAGEDLELGDTEEEGVEVEEEDVEGVALDGL